jgi:signal peptidase I
MLKRIIERWNLRQRRKHLHEMLHHLRHIRHVHDDILTPGTLAKLDELIAEGATVEPGQTEACLQYLDRAPMRAAKFLPRQRLPALREYLDIFAVAFTVAFGIRALYLQPFKIPTSSMQPTLFGIHYIAEEGPDGYRPLPTLPGPLHFLLYSTQRADLTVKRSGNLDVGSFDTFNRFAWFPRTRFNIGGLRYELPGVNGTATSSVQGYALGSRTSFKEGETLCRGWLSLGDHLFVDRVSHHFREPRRGDIVIFSTESIVHQHPLRPPQRLQDQGFYYIKRLVGLPGDVLRAEDNILYVQPAGDTEEVPITDLDPRFAKLYLGRGGYQGHRYGNFEHGANYLLGPDNTFTVPEDSYFVLGDNTSSSLDSRYWGTVPRKNFVGRACFIFWPFSRRWGLPDRPAPLPMPTYGEVSPMTLQ